ncbi:MAG: alpha/beta hydrolase-fold protein [Pseudomonadota bacterium]
MKTVIALSAALLLGACAAPGGVEELESRFDGEIPRIVGDRYVPADLVVPNPDQATIVVFSHGTRRPSAFERCDASYNAPPPTIVALDAGDVHVVRHCSRAIEGTDPRDAGNQVYDRAAELTRLASAYAANGVSPERIFLTGHSNGGWSSLMAYARAPDAFGGVVAFAPAFAGKRSEKWRFPHFRCEARPRQVAELEAAAEIRALVFAYEHDRFNRPEDLAFLPAAHSGARMIAYGCGLRRPHMTALNDCRAAETEAAIRAFIAPAGL